MLFFARCVFSSRFINWQQCWNHFCGIRSEWSIDAGSLQRYINVIYRYLKISNDEFRILIPLDFATRVWTVEDQRLRVSLTKSNSIVFQGFEKETDYVHEGEHFFNFMSLI